MSKKNPVLKNLSPISPEDAAGREKLLQLAGHIARFGGWSVNLAENRVIWSDQVAAIHEKPPGFSPSVEEGINFYAPEWRERISALFGACVKEGRPYDEELEIITARGRRVWVRTIGEPIHDETGRITRVQGAFQDISVQKRVEADLKAAYAQLEALWTIASLTDADVKTIADRILGTITRMSGSQYGFYGFLNEDESVMTVHSWSGEAMKDCSMVDKPRQFLVSEAGVWGEAIRRRAPLILNDYAQGHEAKKGLPHGHVPLTNLLAVPSFSSGRITAVAAVANKDGDYGPHDVTQLTAFLASAQAIVDRRRAEDEREKLQTLNRQLRKSESLGRMAGAVAHHFNNQLQIVALNLELAIHEASGVAPELKRLTAALQTTRAASELSSRMLIYLGHAAAKRELLDLSEVCRRHLPALLPALPHNVVLDADLPAPGPVVSADATQLQDVVTTLVTNAWEAAKDRPAVIRVSVKTVAAAAIPPAGRFPVDAQLHGDAYACLQVADTGEGIAAADFENLFDPFFSTKFTGRGLGLPVALGYVRAAGGVISVESTPGNGSVFRVCLPLAG